MSGRDSESTFKTSKEQVAKEAYERWHQGGPAFDSVTAKQWCSGYMSAVVDGQLPPELRDPAKVRERGSLLLEIMAQRDGWEHSAAEFCRGMEYYRGLVDQIGKLLGDAAYIADDGSRSEDILRAKVPELVAARLGHETEARHDTIDFRDACDEASEPTGIDWISVKEREPDHSEPVVYARPHRRNPGRWSVGIAYWTRSQRWNPEQESTEAPDGFTHWKPLGRRPAVKSGDDSSG